MHGGETEGEIDPALLTSDDKWILLRLDAAIREVTTRWTNTISARPPRRSIAFSGANIAIGISKRAKPRSGMPDAEPPSARKANTLAVIDFVLGHTLRLFHPFLPFITEELWHGLGFNSELPDEQGARNDQFAPLAAAARRRIQEALRPHANDEQFANAKYETVSAGRRFASRFQHRFE